MIATIIISNTIAGYTATIINQEETDPRDFVDCETVRIIEDIELK